MKKTKFEDLKKIYERLDDNDKPIINEMKSNVLLDASKHYSKGFEKFKRFLREAPVSEKIKIRLTKNHIHSITKIYRNFLINENYTVQIEPKNPQELQDKKDAELSNAVYKDVEYRHKLFKKQLNLIDNFVVQGEAWLKIDWDPDAGRIVDYEREIRIEEDEYGNTVEVEYVYEDKPIKEGDFLFEIIPPYNVLVDSGAESIDDARYYIIKKLVDKDDLIDQLEQLYDGEELKKKKSYVSKTGSEKEVYSIINLNSGVVYADDNKVLLLEFYFKPSSKYPKGKVFITTEKGILFEDDLIEDLEGNIIFPLVYVAFDEFSGNNRGVSIIRQLRPIQAEINRTASKIAETQILLGDDKIITPFGSSLTEGERLAGIREIKLKGANAPVVIQGRSGDQFFSYLQMQIDELYQVAQVQELATESGKVYDVLARLYTSMRQRKMFNIYITKFQMFWNTVVETILRYAKTLYTDEKVIYAVGKREAINIQEFRESSDIGYRIKIYPSSEDADSLVGKYLQAKDVLQYAGGQLTPTQIGKIAKEGMRFLSRDLFDDLINQEDIIEDILLQLDRGIDVPITEFDDNDAIIKAIANRMKKPDFRYLVAKNPQVADIYMRQYQQRLEILNQKIQQINEANLGTIPTGGGKIKLDIYKTDEKGNVERVAVDRNAVDWFLQRMEQQGALTSELAGLGTNIQSDLAMLSQMKGQIQGALNGQGGGAPAPQQNMGQ